MKFLGLFIILFIFKLQLSEASSLAEASLWLHEKYSGKSCGDISAMDLASVDQISNASCLSNQTKSPSSLSKLDQDLNKIAENTFFERMAHNLFIETNCELSSLELFEKDASLIKMRSEEIADKLPLIKEQNEFSQLAYFEYQRISNHTHKLAVYCHNLEGITRTKCFEEFNASKEKELAAEKKWLQHKAIVNSTMSTLWHGEMKSMNELILKLLKDSTLPSKDQISQALINTIPKVKKELQYNLQDLVNQSTQSKKSLKFTNLNEDTKRKLVEEAVASGGFLSEAVNQKDESAIKLMCRLEGKYTKGRDSLDLTVGISTLLLSGTTGLISKIPLIARANQIKSLTVITSTLLTGVSFGVTADSIFNNCLSDSPTYMVKKSCSQNSAEYKESEIKKFEHNNCVLNAVLNLAPIGIIGSSKVVKSFTTKIVNLKNIPAPMPSQSVILTGSNETRQLQVTRPGMMKTFADQKLEQEMSLQSEALNSAIAGNYSITKIQKDSYLPLSDVRAIIKSPKPNIKRIEEIKAEIANLRQIQQLNRQKYREENNKQIREDLDLEYIGLLKQEIKLSDPKKITLNSSYADFFSEKTKPSVAYFSSPEYQMTSPQIEQLKSKGFISDVRIVDKNQLNSPTSGAQYNPANKSILIRNTNGNDLEATIQHELTHAKINRRLNIASRNDNGEISAEGFNFSIRSTNANDSSYDAFQSADEVLAFRQGAHFSKKNFQAHVQMSNQAIERNLKSIRGAIETIQNNPNKHTGSQDGYGGILLLIPIQKNGSTTHYFVSQIAKTNNLDLTNRDQDVIDYLKFLERAQLKLQEANNKSLQKKN